jgi:hypothetical protein
MILGGGWPDQGDGFREIADEIRRQREERRIGARFGEASKRGGLGAGKIERAGDGGQRVAALGIGAMGEIIGEQGNLGVAAGREDQPFQQFGESLHAACSCSSSSP